MSKLIIPKYSDANSILLVNKAGSMRKLYCPFQVRVVTEANKFQIGLVLWVEQVASNERDELIYWILGNPFTYSYFEIIASF